MESLYDLRMALRSNPTFMAAAWKHRRWIPTLRRAAGRKLVEPGDDAVIEGYPRSANTFARDFFLASQDRPMEVATHFHSPAQFKLARRYGIPAMLVIREPLPAALSWVVFNDGLYDAETALRYYIDFHKPLLRIPESFVVAPFEEVTSAFGNSIARLNQRFGTNFSALIHDENIQQRIFDAMESRRKTREVQQGRDLTLRTNFPHAEKERRRRDMAGLFDDPSLDGLKADARGYYDALLALARQ